MTFETRHKARRVDNALHRCKRMPGVWADRREGRAMAHSYLSKSGTAQMLHLLSSEPGQTVGRMNPARLERVIATVAFYIAAMQELLDAAQTDVRQREKPA